MMNIKEISVNALFWNQTGGWRVCTQQQHNDMQIALAGVV
jgi:hypothetical protein